ncbi:MAG: 3-dehydroquinate synthase, partial [Cryobacterium sp.]|nr:3-dehydroquinate synthase [Cryobacterium sp.]
MTDNDTTVIPVNGVDSYPVLVGRGLLGTVGEQLGTGVRKVLIVHTSHLGARAVALRESLLDRYEVLIAEVPDAEAAKRVEVAAFCWQVMGQADFSRTDAVIGFGGGAVTDLAGFVAATWLRGVRLVQIPTSVLGMVDAAVGGKNGINTAEGKNLVGTFYAPAAVLCDLDTLDDLPRNEILAGFAEIVKAGFIQVPEILDIIEADVAVATDPRTPEFRRVVELSIEMKARVVGEDFKESNVRE